MRRKAFALRPILAAIPRHKDHRRAFCPGEDGAWPRCVSSGEGALTAMLLTIWPGESPRAARSCRYPASASASLALRPGVKELSVTTVTTMQRTSSQTGNSTCQAPFAVHSARAMPFPVTLINKFALIAITLYENQSHCHGTGIPIRIEIFY